MQALDTICTTSCAGALVEYLERPTSCNDSGTADSIKIWCQPADGGSIPRCRFAFDQVDPTVLNNDNLGTCAAFAFTRICPSTCATALRNISTIMGCCYQNIYNNSLVLDFLRSSGRILSTQMIFLEGLRNSALWGACNVDTPPACSSPIFRDDLVVSDSIVSDSIVNDSVSTVTISEDKVITTAGGNTMKFSVAVLLFSFLCAFLS